MKEHPLHKHFTSTPLMMGILGILLLSTLLPGSLFADEVSMEISYVRGSTAIKILEPEGAHCSLTPDGSALWVEKREVPFSMKASPDLYYTCICTLSSGVVWRKKVEARRGLTAQIRLHLPQKDPAVSAKEKLRMEKEITAKLQKEAEAAALREVIRLKKDQEAAQKVLRDQALLQAKGMKKERFRALFAAVSEESFSSDQIAVIRSAARGDQAISIEQVGELVNLMTHSSDKVEVVEVLRKNIADPENAFLLQKHFTFSSDKETVSNMFR